MARILCSHRVGPVALRGDSHARPCRSARVEQRGGSPASPPCQRGRGPLSLRVLNRARNSPPLHPTSIPAGKAARAKRLVEIVRTFVRGPLGFNGRKPFGRRGAPAGVQSKTIKAKPCSVHTGITVSNLSLSRMRADSRQDFFCRAAPAGDGPVDRAIVSASVGSFAGEE